MKRLPRGGSKVNYTVHILSDLREMLKERAQGLDMTEGYYLSSLVQRDVERAGSETEDIIAIPPSREITSEEREQFGNNLSESRSELPIPVPTDGPPGKAEPEPTRPAPIQRPVMKSITDLQREQSGQIAPLSLSGTPNVLDPGWQNKLHKDLTTGEASEARLRREVLENLPAQKEVKNN